MQEHTHTRVPRLPVRANRKVFAPVFVSMRCSVAVGTLQQSKHMCTPRPPDSGDDDVHSPHTRAIISLCLSASRCVCVRVRAHMRMGSFAAIERNTNMKATIRRVCWCTRNYSAHNWCCSFAIRTRPLAFVEFVGWHMRTHQIR